MQVNANGNWQQGMNLVRLSLLKALQCRGLQCSWLFFKSRKRNKKSKLKRNKKSKRNRSIEVPQNNLEDFRPAKKYRNSLKILENTFCEDPQWRFLVRMAQWGFSEDSVRTVSVRVSGSLKRSPVWKEWTFILTDLSSVGLKFLLGSYLEVLLQFGVSKSEFPTEPSKFGIRKASE